MTCPELEAVRASHLAIGPLSASHSPFFEIKSWFVRLETLVVAALRASGCQHPHGFLGKTIMRFLLSQAASKATQKRLILSMTVHLQYDIHNYMFGVITYVSESHWQPRIPYLFSFFFPVEIAIVKLENHDFFPFNFLFLVFFSKRERERVKNVWKTFVELMRLSLKIAEERERDGETRRFDRGEGDKTLEDC